MSEQDFDHDETEDDGIVTLMDANDNEVDFGILGFIEHGDQEYILLSPVEQLESDDEDSALDIFIFHYDLDEDGAENFSEIEDPAVFEAVQQKAEALLTENGAEMDEHEHETTADASVAVAEDDSDDPTG